jgi:putative transposase
VRQILPGSGTKKCYHITKDALSQRGINIGRDRFHRILQTNNLIIRRRKNHFYTTDSKHQYRKYDNLAQQLNVTKPEQLWVSDITYIATREKPLYLSLVTDAYSKKIMGYHLADHLKATGPIEALKMAIMQRQYPNRKLMHHSDKGVQYCCKAYINLLKKSKISISMTSKYDPYENAIAERINGTLKNEFELDNLMPDFKYANRELNKTVAIYNQLRPHLSCKMMTPDLMHSNNPFPIKLKTKQTWEKIIFDNFILN